MERTLGALPRTMLRQATCKRADRNFRHGYLRWPERAIDRESEEHVRTQRRLRECLGADPRGEPLRWTEELNDFHDLLLRLLEYLPEHRLSAAAACEHPFVRRARRAGNGGESGGESGFGSSTVVSSGGSACRSGGGVDVPTGARSPPKYAAPSTDVPPPSADTAR